MFKWDLFRTAKTIAKKSSYDTITVILNNIIRIKIELWLFCLVKHIPYFAFACLVALTTYFHLLRKIEKARCNFKKKLGPIIIGALCSANIWSNWTWAELCAIDIQTESVLALNKQNWNFQFTFIFLFSPKTFLVWK